jgi:hypothetical protein
MIRLLTTQRGTYPVKRLLEVDGARQRARIENATYQNEVRSGMAGPATYIFADLERVAPPRLSSLAKEWSELEAAGGNRLLNHPTRALRRYELLRTLYEAGINQFNVYRLDEVRRPARYPIFVRREEEHDGPASQLLAGPEQYDNELAAIAKRPLARDHLLAVEFCDTRDRNGMVRKYGATCIGDAIKPFHLYVSRQLFVKHSTDAIVTEETAAEEMRYFDENPHESQLREIFALARIDYGRIDYSFRKGRIQVWEINTNPYWVVDSEPDPLRVPFLERRAEWLAQAFARIDTK